MELSVVTAFMCCALIVLLILKIKSIFWKKDFWNNLGVDTLEVENLFSRLVKQTGIIDLNSNLYHQLKSKGLPYGGYTELGVPHMLAADLDFIRNISIKDFDHFVNRRILTLPDEPLWNLSLLNLENQEWKDLRAAITPTFSTGKIRGMFPIMEQSSQKLTGFLKQELKKSEIINLEDALGNYAIDVIVSIAFGIESNCFDDSNSILTKMAKKLTVQFNPVFLLKVFLANVFPKLSSILNFKVVDEEGGEFFSRVIKSTIEHRVKSGERRNDFLQLMIDLKTGSLQNDSEAKDDLNKTSFEVLPKNNKINNNSKSSKPSLEITDEMIAANSILFIFAGYDTSYAGLLFSVYCLALYPDVQEKLYNELLNLKLEDDEELTNYDIINGFEYLDKFTNEVLRMYPPATSTERTCTKEFHIPNSNVMIPEGTIIGFPAYSIHHDAKYYPDPEKFDPERFSTENKAKRHPFAYTPFGHGPRNCIGNRFALLETKAAIAHLVLSFKFEPCKKTSIPMKFNESGAIKPLNGMWLKVVPRE